MYTGGPKPNAIPRPGSTSTGTTTGTTTGNVGNVAGMGMGMLLGATNKPSGDVEKEMKNKELASRLLEAASKNDYPSLKQALAEGGDPNACDLQNNTLLLLAIKNKNKDMINSLLSAKVDVNVASQDNSPIHESIRQRNVALLEQLLLAGGNINLKADFGKTPIHIAIQENYWDIVDLLLKKKPILH